jgi:class 3 adenylate cyclase
VILADLFMQWDPNNTVSDTYQRIKKLDNEKIQLDRHSGRVTPDIDKMAIGEAREFRLAVLNIDVNGYKNITNNLTNSQILRFLNTFHSEMAYLVRDYSGIVEKFVGDGITAVFGMEEDANLAVIHCINCAITMLTVIKYSINPYFRAIGLPEFTCSIGIDYGNVWLARTGIINFSQQFTLVGLEISIATKLMESAGANKILIGEEVYDNLSTTEKGYCVQLYAPQGWIWTRYKRQYYLYRYNGIWDGYDLR